jgi:type IV secretory pathway TrbL component
MIEFIKHISGLCGEHWHFNIWHLLGYSGSIVFLFYTLKIKIKNFFKINNYDTK